MSGHTDAPFVGRWGYNLTKKDEERFWGQVDRTTTPDGCWPFTGYRNRKGYGRLWINGRMRLAHHVALELVGFIIPAEFLQVLHRCDNPPCCRQSHMKIGTSQDDTDDKVSKGRQATVKIRGVLNGRSRLDPAKVETIRRLYAAGGISQRALARRFGISHPQIGRIIRGEGWNP